MPTTIGLITIDVTSSSCSNLDDIEAKSKHWWTWKTCKENMNINLIPNWEFEETLSAKKVCKRHTLFLCLLEDIAPRVA